MIYNTSPIRGSTSESTADATFTKSGEGVNAGRRMTRLNLNGLENDKQFAVALKTENKWSDSIGKLITQLTGLRNNVKISVNNEMNGNQQIVSVNINSLSKRLHLSKSEIKQAYVEGHLESLVHNHLAQNPNLRSAINSYRTIFSHYESKIPSQLLNRLALFSHTRLSPATLMKVVKMGLSNTQAAAGPQLSTVDVKSYGMTHRYHLIKDNADLKIMAEDMKQRLGGGAFGVVYSLPQVGSKSSIAKKEAISESAITEAHREYDAITRIKARNPEATVVDIYCIYQVNSNESANGGYFAKQESSDVKKALSDPSFANNTQIIQNGASQLLRQMRDAHRAGVAHHDLKPENFLLDAESNTFKIADWGSSQFENENPGPIGGDPAYISVHDYDAIKNDDAEYNFDFQCKKDSFAMGKALLAMTNPEIKMGTVKRSVRTFVDPNQLFIERPGTERVPISAADVKQSIIAKGYSQELADQIMNMISPDRAARPT